MVTEQILWPQIDLTALVSAFTKSENRAHLPVAIVRPVALVRHHSAPGTF